MLPRIPTLTPNIILGPPDPPVVWTHPCKCTLVAHEDCLLHWIKTQQRDFGRSRGELKCPQCGELYEFEGFNPRILRIFNAINRALSRSGRVVTAGCIGTIIFSSGAGELAPHTLSFIRPPLLEYELKRATGIYLACASYGAFAVREFVGPDIFRALLTSNPSNWPLHAWFYLPMIPFSLIISRTPFVIWTTSPLVPLLFPWSSTLPVAAIARASGRSVQFGPFTGRLTLWPPPPALVCALFPVIRVLYSRLRDRIIGMIMHDIFPTWAQAIQQWQQQRGVQQGIPEQQPRGNQQERVQHLRIQIRAGQQQQQQQQPQQPRPQQQRQHQQLPAGARAGHRLHFQLGEFFGLEIAQVVFNHLPRDVPIGPLGPGPGAANGGDGRAVDNPAEQQQQQHRDADAPVQAPERDPPAQAPADQDPQQQQQQQQQQEQEQQQQQQQQQPPPEPQQPQRAEPGQGGQQEPAPRPARDDDEFGELAQRAIRVGGASLGRLVGGALLMPSIARVMGSVLLRISHAVPLVRTIIAPLPPPPLLRMLPLPPPSGPISALVRLIRGGRADPVQVGYQVDGHGWLSGSGPGAMVLRMLLATSQEWATSDPVWYVLLFPVGVSQLIHPSVHFPSHM